MADKRQHRSGAHDGSKPKRYRSDPSRGSSASDLSLTHPSASGRRSSHIGFTNSSNSSMNPDQYHPDQYHQFSVPSQAPFCADTSRPPSPSGVSAPQMDSNHRDRPSHYFEQGWCYTAESPEPMDYGDPVDSNVLEASIYVFASESKRPTLVEEKHTEKETTRDGRNKRSHTNNADTVPTWEAEPRGYLMSQGSMEVEGHTYYERYFDIPVSQETQPLYRYVQNLDNEDFDSPEPNDRPGNIDAAADRRVDWADQTQGEDQTQEEEGWDIVEMPYPEADGCENDQGGFAAQGYYQAGAASWFSSVYRH